LSFSAIVAAGLDGIKKKIPIGDPVDEDIFKMSSQRRKELGIRQLPASLREACESLEADRNFLKPIFSDDALDNLIEQEIKEHNEVVVRPHPHEFSMYANV
jgi:glutamine synthetase